MSKAKIEVPAGDFARPTKGGVYVKVWVSPGGKRTAVKGLYGEDALKLFVAASPVEAKANAEVERYLAQLLGLSRSEVDVVKGTSGRDKLIFVRGLEPDEIRTPLSTLP